MLLQSKYHKLLQFQGVFHFVPGNPEPLTIEGIVVTTTPRGDPIEDAFYTRGNFTASSLQTVFTNWNLSNYHFVYVCIEKNDNIENQKLLFKSVIDSLKLLSRYIKVGCVLGFDNDSSFNEDFSTIIRQDVPCIRIYHSCTNSTQPSIRGCTGYNHYIFTEMNSYDFISELAQLCTSLPVICSGSDMYNQAGFEPPHLIQTGNVRVMYVTDNVVHINSSPINEKCLSIESINSDTLLLWLGDHFGAFSHLRRIYSFISADGRNSARCYVYKRHYTASNVLNTYLHELQPETYEQLVVFHLQGRLLHHDLSYFIRLLRKFLKKNTKACLVVIVDLVGLLFEKADFIASTVTKVNSNPSCRTVAIVPKSVFEEAGSDELNLDDDGDILHNIDGCYGTRISIDTYITSDYDPDFRESNYKRLVNLSVPYVEVTMSVDIERGNQRRVEICKWYKSGDCEHRLVANDLYDHYSACEAIIASFQADRNQLIEHVYNNSECFDLIESEIYNPALTESIPNGVFDALLEKSHENSLDEAKHSVWAFVMAWVIKIVLKYLKNGIEIPDMPLNEILSKPHISVLYKYFRCKKSESQINVEKVVSSNCICWPYTNRMFKLIAMSALANEPVSEIALNYMWNPIVQGDNNCNLLYLVPILAYLDRITEVTAILKSSNNVLVVPYLLYSLAIFKKKHTCRFCERKNEWLNVNAHETRLLKNCASELDMLARGIVHDLFTYDEELSEELLLTVNKQLNCSSLQLAYVAEAKNVLSHPACIKTVKGRLWTDLQHFNSLWYMALMYILYPFYFLRSRLQDGSKLFGDSMAPAIKCIYHGIYYLCFLIAYSYLVMAGFGSQGFTKAEYVIICWLGTIVIEHIIKIAYYIRKGVIKRRISSVWGILESLIVLFSISTFGIRLAKANTNYSQGTDTYNSEQFTKSSLNVSHNVNISSDILHLSMTKNTGLLTDISNGNLLFGLTLTLLYIRFLQFFQIHEQIGPLITMIGTFLSDLRHFMFILLVILMGYSVSLHTILKPTTVPSFSEIVIVPFMHIFAEVEMDNILCGPLEKYEVTNTCDKPKPEVGPGN